MATLAGAHSERVARAGELRSSKGRREQGRFAFEGPTLLEEAQRSAIEIVEIFATETVYEHNGALRAIEHRGTPVYTVEDRTMRKISDVETPTGLLAVAAMRFAPLEQILASPLSAILADLNDPGNVGTLLRSAEAFGAGGVVIGSLGVDPYHPKVVRAAMGSIFRLPVAVATPQNVAAIADRLPVTIVGLDASGSDLREARLEAPVALVVGHERRGLGPWDTVCSRRYALPMAGIAESLNAAIAGSIALYEAGGKVRPTNR